MQIRAAEPLVSVLIPFRNAESTIAVAIRSILNQSYRNFELILCDDGSTDHSVSAVRNFSDERIILVENTGEHGPAPARNVLLRKARGKYIAWLDADDIALPHRLQVQVEWMENHPDTDIAGSFALLRRYRKTKRRLPHQPEVLQQMMLFKNFILQPTVISRNFYKDENIFYNESCNYLEDFELWSRLNGTKRIASIPEYLTSYLVPLPEEEESKRGKWNFYHNIENILRSNAAKVGIHISDDELKAWAGFASGQSLSRAEIRRMQHIWSRVVKKNRSWYTSAVRLSFQMLAGNKNVHSLIALLRVIVSVIA